VPTSNTTSRFLDLDRVATDFAADFFAAFDEATRARGDAVRFRALARGFAELRRGFAELRRGFVGIQTP
jgi:hypothetical protein